MNKIVQTVNNANNDRENATNELANLIKQAEQEKRAIWYRNCKSKCKDFRRESKKRSIES